MANNTRVETFGKFFEHNRDGRLNKAFNESLLDIAVLASGWVKEQLYSGHGFRSGYLKGSVHGGMVKNLHAQIDAGELMKGRNVEYASWVEGVADRNKRSRFKGYRMFREVFNRLKGKPKEVEEIMAFHIKKAVGE